MNTLQKRSLITPEMLDGKAYVESLLEAGLETGLLRDTEHARIQYDLLELLAVRLETLYGKRTDSVPEEIASEVFESLLYTIGVFLKSVESGDTALKLLTDLPPEFLYQKGLRVIQILVRDVRVLAGEIFDLLGVEYDKNSTGMFLWGKVADGTGEQLADKVLYEAGVFITPGFIFGKNGEDYVRISLCAKPEVLKTAHAKILSVLGK